MKDKLEKFVIDNREAFDDKEAGRGVWNRISKELHGNSRTFDSSWLWKAAAIFFFGTSAFLLGQQSINQSSADRVSSQAKEEFTAVETYYISEINNKKEEISDYYDKNIQLRNDVNEDLGKLDAMYLVLKDRLEKDPSKEVVDALILNLIMRMDILTKQVQQLQDVESQQNIEPNRETGA